MKHKVKAYVEVEKTGFFGQKKKDMEGAPPGWTIRPTKN